MSAPRANRKSGKLVQEFPDFSGGLNSSVATHLAAENEVVSAWNFSLEEEGSISKRKGYSKIVDSLGPLRIQGLYLFRRFTTSELLAVYDGVLHKYVTLSPDTLLGTGTWEPVTIRRPAPENVKAVVQTTGAVGANLVANKKYDYSLVSKDASGQSMTSQSVPRGTQASPAYPIKITWDKVIGATGYDIYRSVDDGPMLRLKSVEDVAEWTDTGADAPVAAPEGAPPLSNTTVVTLPSNTEMEFVNYNDRVFFTTGEGICTYSGATDASLISIYGPTDTEQSQIGLNALKDPSSSIHRCRYIKLHWDRLFLSGDPDLPQNVYFTDLGLSPNFPQVYIPAVYSFDVTSASGSPITGMVNFRDTLTVFTSDSIHAVFGSQPDEAFPDFFILRPIHPEIGAMSGRSIVLVGNSVLFVSRQGIYALTNVVASNTYMNVKYISGKVEDTYRTITRPDLAVAVYHDHQYKVSFPEDNLTFRWYVNRQAWAMDEGYRVGAYVVRNADLYWSSQVDGNVYKMGFKRVETGPGVFAEVDAYSDDGVAIPLYFRTKTHDGTSTINRKKFRELVVVARQYMVPTSIHVKGTIDYLVDHFDFDFNESAVLGVGKVGTMRLGWVDVVHQVMRFKGKGHQVFLEFSNDKLDEPVTIYMYGLEYKIKAF